MTEILRRQQLNRAIAEHFGWTVWEKDGRWFQERPLKEPGMTRVSPLHDYLRVFEQDPIWGREET